MCAFCLTPVVLGHGVLVKNDLAASFGYLLFWYRAWRYWRAPTWRNGAWMGVGVLAGVLAKFSLAILLPIAPMVIAARHSTGRHRSLRRAAAGCASCAVVVYVGMLAAWQFRLEPLAFSELQAWKADSGIPKILPKAVHVLSAIPLPGAFWRGGMSLVRSNHSVPSYLLGQTTFTGDPWYFLVALAVKIPVAIQALLAIAFTHLAGVALSGRLLPGDWCWLLPGFLYLGLASLSGLQIGIRLVLPAIVFLLLASAKAFEKMSSRRSLRFTALALMLFLAGRTAHAYPNYIATFNLWVSDSWRGLENVWAYFDERQIELIAPPWSAELTKGRTRFEPASGYYAISGTLLTGQYFAPPYRDYYSVFRGMQPVGQAGGSIFIFRVP